MCSTVNLSEVDRYPKSDTFSPEADGKLWSRSLITDIHTLSDCVQYSLLYYLNGRLSNYASCFTFV